MKVLFLFVLCGCATVTLDDLYAQRAACVSQDLDCSDLDEAIEKKEDMREWKQNAKMNCPDGYVGYCDSRFHDNCGRTRSKTPIEYECVRQDVINGMFTF